MTNAIPQHAAVDTDRDDRKAVVNQNIQFRGGKKGVVLHRRDKSIIGYPIPLANGRFLVAEKFGRHNYHEDARPMFLALGKQVGKAKALELYRAHPVYRDATLAAARMINTHSYDDPPAKLADKIGTHGQSTYWNTEDGRVIESRTSYDFPTSYWLVDLRRDQVAELI